jgi:hypothetical protein
MRWFSFLLPLLWLTGCAPPPSDPPPAFLSRQEFAATIEALSEPPGFFDSDNFVSNEAAYLHVVARMRDIGVHGGVYIGVGPDQNFTYIAKIQPKYAFILDIRRDNMLEHLLFKALFEMADTRQAYLSRLFSKPIPSSGAFPPHASIADLVAFFDRVEGDEAYYQENLAEIKRRIPGYGIPLTEPDLQKIAHAYRAFFTHHLDLQWEYRSDGTRGIPFIPYRDFLLGTDREGRYGNFLHSDEEFAYIRSMEARNLIIPVTGDFAGTRALRAIGAYIRSRGDHVSAFYLSNVEYYLVPDGRMNAFAANVHALPIADHSVLIRAFVNLRDQPHPLRVDGHLMTTVLQYIRSFNTLYAEGRYKTYFDTGTADFLQ